MKIPLVIAFGLLAIGSLGTGAQTLTKQQVKEIAELVLNREHEINLPITKFTYDKKTDLWLCEQVHLVAPDLDIRVEVRDRDRYYRRLYGASEIGPKSNKFRMSPKLKREISKISPIKKRG